MKALKVLQQMTTEQDDVSMTKYRLDYLFIYLHVPVFFFPFWYILILFYGLYSWCICDLLIFVPFFIYFIIIFIIFIIYMFIIYFMFRCCISYYFYLCYFMVYIFFVSVRYFLFCFIFLTLLSFFNHVIIVIQVYILYVPVI